MESQYDIKKHNMNIPVSIIEEAAKINGQEYQNEILSIGEIIGDRFMLHYDDFLKIKLKYGIVFGLELDVVLIASHKNLQKGQEGEETPTIESPSTRSMALSLFKEIGKSAKTGFKRVSEEAFNQRLSICNDCNYWDKEGFFGYGRCKACGCSKAKLWLATSSCPIKKWESEL